MPVPLLRPLRTWRAHAQTLQRSMLLASLGLLLACAAPAKPPLALRAAAEPAQTEAQAMAEVTAPVVNTYWKLVRLAGQVTPPAEPNQPEAHLVLESGTGRFHGAGGCNRLQGAYVVQEGRLSLTAIASSRRVCPRGMALEQALMAALGRVEYFEVQGQRLTMLGANGQALLHWEAVYLR